MTILIKKSIYGLTYVVLNITILVRKDEGEGHYET